MPEYPFLTLVVIVTWETEIRKIIVRNQPRQISLENPSRKYPVQKWAGGVAQVVGDLPSKCQALNSSPSTAKKKVC
jgi:hypothetical protein